MAQWRHADRTLCAKLVYYGCGMGGKTTSLQVVHEIMCPRNEVQLVSIKTEEDATLLFDFLPIDIGEVEGLSSVAQQRALREFERRLQSAGDRRCEQNLRDHHSSDRCDSVRERIG